MRYKDARTKLLFTRLKGAISCYSNINVTQTYAEMYAFIGFVVEVNKLTVCYGLKFIGFVVEKISQSINYILINCLFGQFGLKLTSV